MHLPSEVRSRHTYPGVTALDPKQLHNAAREVMACITWDVYPDPVIGSDHSAKFAILYQQEVDKQPKLEEYPATLQEAAMKLLQKLTIGHAAAESILRDKPPPNNPFDDSYANYFARKKWAMDCLATARDWTFDYLFEISRQLRENVAEKFVKPLSDTKRWIERAEIFLYVMGAIIALYEQMPPERSPGDPIGSSRYPDLNDPQFRTPRPIRRQP